MRWGLVQFTFSPVDWGTVAADDAAGWLLHETKLRGALNHAQRRRIHTGGLSVCRRYGRVAVSEWPPCVTDGQVHNTLQAWLPVIVSGWGRLGHGGQPGDSDGPWTIPCTSATSAPTGETGPSCPSCTGRTHPARATRKLARRFWVSSNSIGKWNCWTAQTHSGSCVKGRAGASGGILAPRPGEGRRCFPPPEIRQHH